MKYSTPCNSGVKNLNQKSVDTTHTFQNSSKEQEKKLDQSDWLIYVDHFLQNC